MIILPGLDELLVNKIALVDNITLVFDEVIPTVKFTLSFRIFATTIHALLLIWGVVGNTLVTIVVQKDKSIRTPTYYYLASLTIADLIVLVSALPETIVSYHLYVRQWIFGSFGCSAWVFLNFLGINVSSTSILCFTVERYIGLCRPLLAQKLCTPKRACYVIAASWVMGVIYASPWLFLTRLNPHLDYPEMQTCDYSLERKRYANVFLADLVLFYIFPLTVSITLYIKIGLTLGLSHKMSIARSVLRQTSHNTLAGRAEDRLTPEKDCLPRQSMSRRNSITIVEKESVTGMLFVIVILFAVLLLPYRVLLVYNSVAEHPYLNNWYLLFAKTFIFINSSINPFLFNVMSKKFRKAFMKVIFRIPRESTITDV